MDIVLFVFMGLWAFGMVVNLIKHNWYLIMGQLPLGVLIPITLFFVDGDSKVGDMAVQSLLFTIIVASYLISWHYTYYLQHIKSRNWDLSIFSKSNKEEKNK